MSREVCKHNKRIEMDCPECEAQRRPRCVYCGGYYGYCEPMGDGCNEQGIPMPLGKSYPLVRADKLNDALARISKLREALEGLAELGWTDKNRGAARKALEEDDER